MGLALEQRSRWRNILQSTSILILMAAILGGIGWLIGGMTGLLWTAVIGMVLFIFTPKITPGVVLRMYNASPIQEDELPGLCHLVEALSRKAGLKYVPGMYYIPSRVMNAFSVGSRDDAVIALSDGLLRSMSRREIAGILAHELNHIRHNDLWIMQMADNMSRITHSMSMVGQVMLLLFLPFYFAAGTSVPWLIILFLIVAPLVSMLLQMALSRTREYDADLGALQITGDPEGLASALKKLEVYQKKLIDLLIMPGRKNPDPSLLRSHPHTEKRLERLYKLGEQHQPEKEIDVPGEDILSGRYSPVRDKPRWKWWGGWY